MMRVRFRGFSTFRARIFWSVIPILVALLIFHGVMDLREHRRLFTDEFMRRGQAMASNLAYSGELGVFAEDRKPLETSMRGVPGDLDFAYVVVYGEDGKVLAEGPGHDGLVPVRKEPLSDQDRQRLLRERRPLVKTIEGPAGNLVDFLAPIMTEAAKSPDELVLGSARPGPAVEKRAIGVVRLGLSPQSVEHRMGILMRLWVGVTLFFF